MQTDVLPSLTSQIKKTKAHICRTNPPTPAASRGSASEEALLATRGEKRKSADPCRQQGERIREEITSNKCCAVQVRGKSGAVQEA